jgi:hypothetical protein
LGFRVTSMSGSFDLLILCLGFFYNSISSP